MTRFAESYAVWLADYYLLTTVLLALSLTGIALLKQPAQRLMVTKSTLVASVLLAILSALPGWSVVHLLAADHPAVLAQPPREEPVALAEAAVRPNPTQNNPVRRPAPPASGTQTADDDLAKPNTPKMSWPALLAIAHATGMGCIVVWLALGWIASVRLRGTVHVAPANVSAILDELASLNSRASKPLRLFTHDRIDVAVALGVWRPMILLPNRWTSSQPHDRLQAILAHEATHVLNYDLQWVALARILFVALWANPLFWLTKRRLRLDQEALADAAAAEVTSRQQYAEQLVAWARDTRSRPALHLSSAVGLWESPSQLRQRIAILLDEQLTVLRNCSRSWRIAVGILVIAAALSLSTVTLQPASRANESSSTEKAATAAAVPATAARDKPTDKSKARSAANRVRREPNADNGRVLDDKNQPIAGAEVLLFRINQRDGTRKFVAKKTADVDGRYRFDNVIDIDKEFPGRKFPGSYEVGDEALVEVIRAPGRITNVPLLMPQEVAKFGDYHEVKMLPAATLRGRVTDASGTPVAGALVSIDNGPNPPWEESQASRTDANGYYKIEDAGPFDEVEFKKQVADQERQRKAEEAGETVSPYDLFATQPILRVDHPDYAVTRATVEKSPGTKDVQLPPAAILEGHVVFADSGKPAAGVLVGIVTSIERHNPLTVPPLTDQHKLFVRTDADGKYHAGSLPSGKYELWAETPGWVSVGVDGVAAVANKTSVVPDLKFTKGGTVSARIIDAKTRQPIPLPKDARVMMLAGMASNRFSFRRIDAPFITANSQGRFEFQLTPGKRALGAGGVEVDGDLKFSGIPSAEVNVVEGKTTDVDLPVEEMQPTVDTEGATTQGDFNADGNHGTYAHLGPPGGGEKTKATGEQPPIKDRRVVENDAKTASDTNNDAADAVFFAASQPGTPNVLEGQCVDENGKPLAGVEVLVARTSWQDAGHREVVAKQTTQSDGKFRFDKVVDIAKVYPNGKIPKLPDFTALPYQVAARQRGRVSESRSVAQNDLALLGSRMTFKMPAAATLRGRITNPKGEPVAGALVSVGYTQMDRWEGFQTARTGIDGRYEIADAPKLDLKNQNLTRPPNNDDDYVTFWRPIFVEHPNYASRFARCEGIPGSQDVQLKAAAVITGRIVDGVSKQPIAGARVQAFASQPNTDIEAGTSFALTNADSHGEYRISTLPAGHYDLWADAPNRVNEGVKKLLTSSERVTAAPALVMLSGGTIRVRIVDAKSRQPIPLRGDERAQVSVRPRPPLSTPAMVDVVDGRFPLLALPGENHLSSGAVFSREAFEWIVPPGEDITVHVVERKGTDIDVPVREFKPEVNPRSLDERTKAD